MSDSARAAASEHFPGTALRRPTAVHTGIPIQPTLDDLGTPLADVTFVVLDLETTGMSPGVAGITEIGAVKVRGGEVLGEFSTLVNPGMAIPAQITRLTGISSRMVASAPPITAVLPSLWEFLVGAVVVAHNANFDVSFLRAAGSAMHLPWPGNQVVDTVALARRVVTRDEAPNHKLSTLARLFGAEVTPDHRALTDARATVDVLHALLSRMAPWGITHLEDLRTATDPVAPAVRAKRHLADDLPTGPGVYQFLGPDDEILYIGTSENLRKRVRSYFTASEKRSKMREMLQITSSVRAIPCPTVIEAGVRELRLIAEHAPRYNRRSKFPHRMPWIRLTDEAAPRLSIVTTPDRKNSSATYIGPFSSRRAAKEAIEVLQVRFPIRECGGRLPLIAKSTATACALAEMGRCPAPCIAHDDGPGHEIRATYEAVVAEVRAAILTDPGPVVDRSTTRMAELVAREDFEAAAQERDRLTSFLSGIHRGQLLAPLAVCRELVAAVGTDDGAWTIVVIRFGRLAASAFAPKGTDPVAVAEAAMASAEHVAPPVLPSSAAHPEESLRLNTWLEQEGVRLLEVSDPLSCPVAGAGAHQELIRSSRRARQSTRAQRV